MDSACFVGTLIIKTGRTGSISTHDTSNPPLRWVDAHACHSPVRGGGGEGGLRMPSVGKWVLSVWNLAGKEGNVRFSREASG